MRIIGHRGSAGTKLENTKASLLAAIKAGADSVEIDVRKTRDNQLVVSHDASFDRVSSNQIPIAELSLREIRAIELSNQEHPLSLADALRLTPAVTTIVELKDAGSTRALLGLLDEFPNSDIRIASFKPSELAEVKAKKPALKTYLLGKTKPFDILYVARTFQFYGIGLNFWIMNPLIYRLARHFKLDMYVYTVNNPFMQRWFRLFYPKVALCTDYPKRAR